MADRYLDPELYDPERPCRTCGRHQGECDGPPSRCCEACDHWQPVPHVSDEIEDVPALLAEIKHLRSDPRTPRGVIARAADYIGHEPGCAADDCIACDLRALLDEGAS